MIARLLVIAIAAWVIQAAAMCRGQAGELPEPPAGEARPWKSQVESDWLRQAGTIDDSVALGAATARAVQLAQATLRFVERKAARPELAAELKALEDKIAGAGHDAAWKGLYLETRWLRRRILLSHPLVAFDRLLINKCPPPMMSRMCDQCLGRWSRPGPDGGELSSDARLCAQNHRLARASRSCRHLRPAALHLRDLLGAETSRRVHAKAAGPGGLMKERSTSSVPELVEQYAKAFEKVEAHRNELGKA